MKPRKLQTTVIVAIAAVAAISAFARPIEFREVSLLVRAHESDQFIVSTVADRKLSRPLTSQEETKLRSQGASDSLIRSLRAPNLVSSQADTASSEVANTTSAETASAAQRQSSPKRRTNVEIVDLGIGQPINLSTWGGPDLDLTFRPRDIVETGRDEVELIEPASSHVHYATYRGYRVPGWEPVDPQYTSITAHTFTRSLPIDWTHPVRFDDVPYLLYPIYATRGASLYFVGRMSDDAVRLAVVSR
jgi:hypothetical protein